MHTHTYRKTQLHRYIDTTHINTHSHSRMHTHTHTKIHMHTNSTNTHFNTK